MILLRRLNGPLFTLNPDLIERAEATPDTVVTLVGGNKYVVAETLEELVDLIRDYRARIIASAESMLLDSADPRPQSQTRVRALPSSGPGQPVVPLRRGDS